MTNDELAAIERRLSAATDGPWETYLERTNSTSIMRTMDKKWIAHLFKNDDAIFLAHAPVDVRLLLDEVTRLREKEA